MSVNHTYTQLAVSCQSFLVSSDSKQQVLLIVSLFNNAASSEQSRLVTRSVVAGAGFDRHGMPPPASNDTGTAFCFSN